ncbi:MAG: zf-TFIIB domain-containing protein [Deltaproteobacteria bacterium]|nr:zf-TFIIB domain-containing protein [Deltaproteobacteria bacterium]
MAVKDRIIVKCGDSEEVFFQQQQADQIKKLREKSAKETAEQYREDHKYHCFRCGTDSLVEVQKGKCVIDICVNEGCGAVHLDPGELETILQDRNLIKQVKKSVFLIFK